MLFYNVRGQAKQDRTHHAHLNCTLQCSYKWVYKCIIFQSQYLQRHFCFSYFICQEGSQHVKDQSGNIKWQFYLSVEWILEGLMEDEIPHAACHMSLQQVHWWSVMAGHLMKSFVLYSTHWSLESYFAGFSVICVTRMDQEIYFKKYRGMLLFFSWKVNKSVWCVIWFVNYPLGMGSQTFLETNTLLVENGFSAQLCSKEK